MSNCDTVVCKKTAVVRRVASTSRCNIGAARRAGGEARPRRTRRGERDAPGQALSGGRECPNIEGPSRPLHATIRILCSSQPVQQDLRKKLIAVIYVVLPCSRTGCATSSAKQTSVEDVCDLLVRNPQKGNCMSTQ